MRTAKPNSPACPGDRRVRQPYLTDGVAVLHCLVTDSLATGDHTLFIAEVPRMPPSRRRRGAVHKKLGKDL
jgi:flavin reductase (DIM6/NTAB) family NADH-FMN oxidoreductase RutF